MGLKKGNSSSCSHDKAHAQWAGSGGDYMFLQRPKLLLFFFQSIETSIQLLLLLLFFLLIVLASQNNKFQHTCSISKEIRILLLVVKS